MKISNKDVIQSYILTTAKYEFNVYEKRVLYRLVELAQADLEGKKLLQGYTINKTLFEDRIVKLPIKAFLNGEKDKNHKLVKQALKDLRNKTIEFETTERWELIGIIEKPKIEKYDDTVEFEVNPRIWNAILSFAKGFRKYELKTAMSFETVYAMRFYELFSGQKTPIIYTVENLKIMFGLEGKYKMINDFVKRVIIPAKEELDKKAPYSFEFKTLKAGRKIKAIKFYPYEIHKNRDTSIENKQLAKQVSLSWDLDKIIVDYLEQTFGFTTDEIKRNLDLFKLANSKIDLLASLSKIKRKALEANKGPKPYVIGTLKKMISQTK